MNTNFLFAIALWGGVGGLAVAYFCLLKQQPFIRGFVIGAVISIVLALGCYGINFAGQWNSASEYIPVGLIWSFIVGIASWVFIPRRYRCADCRAWNHNLNYYCHNCGQVLTGAPPAYIFVNSPFANRRAMFVRSCFWVSIVYGCSFIVFFWIVAMAFPQPSTFRMERIQPNFSSGNAQTPLPTTTPIPVSPIVMAVQDIPAGMRIQPEMIMTRDFPIDFFPQGTFADAANVAGQIARMDIVRESIITSPMLVNGDVFYPVDLMPAQPFASLPRGEISVNVAVSGILSNSNRLEDWILQGNAGATYTLELRHNARCVTMMVWNIETEVWVQSREIARNFELSAWLRDRGNPRNYLWWTEFGSPGFSRNWADSGATRLQTVTQFITLPETGLYAVSIFLNNDAFMSVAQPCQSGVYILHLFEDERPPVSPILALPVTSTPIPLPNFR